VAVRLNMCLGRVFRVLGGMGVVSVSVCHVSVVGGLFVIALGVRRGGMVMVARSVLVVFRCLRVVFGCFVRHG
jgi:hypothetical protein